MQLRCCVYIAHAKTKPMRILFLTIISLFTLAAFSQGDIAHKKTSLKNTVEPKTVRQVKAVRTTGNFKIDGEMTEPEWEKAGIASNFVEWRPTPGRVEDKTNRTEVYFLYDNNSVYIGGFCHESISDSISRELVGRDVVGINDFVGVIFDTYYDKINGVGFYVTPYGEQYDAKYSNSGNEDDSWNAVWESAAKIHDNGWSFEMRIPYSALRFVSSENQTWGLNITRRRNKTGQQYMWNPIDPKVSGFVNQEGEWTGIGKIEAPPRLSFSPYLSAYLNHYPTGVAGKNMTSSINGGMDVKYGISDAFTLDMTLIPDFGQVRSDNQILNLSPFEVKYNENRSFFTEGTELFNKGNLFYSRRIGGTPLHFGDAYDNLGENEYVKNNPTESKLLNATKISGRTKSGLGLGFFNAISKPMYAIIEDSISRERREVQTGSLTNYNILVADQSLKNNSSVSLINTSTIREGSDYDANVTAAVIRLNNRKNTYSVSGQFGLSQLMAQGKNSQGYSHSLGFGKTSGRWMFQLKQELADAKYNVNDMGILFNNNYVDHFFWSGYRWLKPSTWFNNAQINFNANHSQLFQSIANQKVSSRFQSFKANVNANMQLKNLWFVGMYVGYSASGNDFYEPREPRYAFKTPQRRQMNIWFESNQAKKYHGSFNYFVGLRDLFNSANHELNVSHSYRFSDKFSLTEDLNYSISKNEAGFYDKFYENSQLEDILFSRRNRKTIENVISAKYNFNNKSGITFRARHYWSGVEQKQLYDLNADGTLAATKHAGLSMENRNFNIFNIDAMYTLQFAPGSFINIVWKDESFMANDDVKAGYFKNFDRTFGAPQNNNLSIKIIYFLDYLDVRKTLDRAK